MMAESGVQYGISESYSLTVASGTHNTVQMAMGA